MGTLEYMSPEQRADSSSVTTASDIFSLGVVLYELFVGSKPVGRFKSPREQVPGLPAALDELILRCLEKQPERRPQSVTEIVEVLERLPYRDGWDEEKAGAWWSRNAAEPAAQSLSDEQQPQVAETLFMRLDSRIGSSG